MPILKALLAGVKKTCDKLLLTAQAIAAIEKPQDVFMVTPSPTTQRAVLPDMSAAALLLVSSLLEHLLTRSKPATVSPDCC